MICSSRKEFFAAFPKKYHKKLEGMFPAEKTMFVSDDFAEALRSIEDRITPVEAGMSRLGNGCYRSKKHRGCE